MALLLSFILAALAQAGQAPVHIRVRLNEAVPKAAVRGFDLRFYPDSKRGAFRGFDKQSEWELRCEPGLVRAVPVNGTEKRSQPLKFTGQLYVESPAGFITYRGRPYRDGILVTPAGGGCEVVNHVELEKYLDGLVNSEFNSKWNEEAIAAQVVAARTYALYQIRAAAKDAKARFDVDATVKDQVYDGSIKEDFRASRSVERTKGWILTASPESAEDPAPIKAFYHSVCGGMTELPESVWSQAYPGFKKTVRCPYCVVAPKFKWTADLAAKEIAQALLDGARREGALAGWPKSWQAALEKGSLIDLRITERNSRGRVSRMAVSLAIDADEGKGVIELPILGGKFREWMGATKVRSTLFELLPHRQLIGGPGWQLDGRGNGHGVGLCQWGAKIMGEKGGTMASILHHYYPDARLTKLW